MEMKMNKRNMLVQNIPVTLLSYNDEDYICITDMAKVKSDSVRAADIIKNWLRARTTLEFLGTWEQLFNPNFKVVEFDHFKQEAGLHTFTLSVSEWINSTNAIGLKVKGGKYGGTYAHKDIAFEFGSAINPVFKLYLLKEYQKLKEKESKENNLEWNVRRILSKNNYIIHTDAIKNYILQQNNIADTMEWIVYANEADLLNMALFGCTAAQWRKENPELSKKYNMRDVASIAELTVLSNLETHNAELIKNGIEKSERYLELRNIAAYQLNILQEAAQIEAVKKLN